MSNKSTLTTLAECDLVLRFLRARRTDMRDVRLLLGFLVMVGVAEYTMLYIQLEGDKRENAEVLQKANAASQELKTAFELLDREWDTPHN